MNTPTPIKRRHGTRNYLPNLKRILSRKKMVDAVTEVEHRHKQIIAIDRLIELQYLTIDFVEGIAAITPYLHIYYQNVIEKDETKLYRGFCQMLRLWINFQRAYKKGDLLRMLEAGEYDDIILRELAEAPERRAILPPPTLSPEESREWLTAYIEKRYGTFEDTKPLKIVVVNSKGGVSSVVDECSYESSINFHVIGDKKEEEETSDINQ